MKRSCATLLLCSLSATANAVVFNVTRTDDPAPDGCLPLDCSLREAVMAANASTGRDVVRLGALTYSLTRIDTSPGSLQPDLGPLQVTDTLTVDGVGITRTRVRWNTPFKFQNQVFLVDSSVTPGQTLMLSDMIVSGGRGSQGGCISMTSISPTYHRLILEDTRVEGCYASIAGGGLNLAGTDLSLRGAQIVDNSTGNHGGAMQLVGALDIDSRSSQVSDNSAGADGGAVRIYGNGIIGWQSYIVWIDDGTSVIAGNTAGGDGGAFSLRDTATLDLSTDESAPVGQLLRIEGNSAAGAGGGLSLEAGITPVMLTNRLHRVRINGNSAASGGGIEAGVSLQVSASEISGNAATSGPGGGVSFTGSTEWAQGRNLQRVGIHHNTAMGSGGGGVSSDCASFTASDASIHMNQAASGRGQGIETIGPAQLRHVTLLGNNSLPVIGAPGLYKRHHSGCGDTTLTFANSLITDYCSATVASQLVSQGGSQLGVDASACPALPSADERQTVASVFLIGLNPYGGDFEVVGWASDSNTRPQRDFGLAAFCTATDARGFPRADGFCDAGAFEQQ